MGHLSNVERIALVTREIGNHSSKRDIAKKLDCTIPELREWVEMNLPTLRADYERLPFGQQPHSRQQHIAREQRARERAERESAPRRDWQMDEIVNEMWEIRRRLGLGPRDRILPALPLAMQSRIKDEVRQFIEYAAGIRESLRIVTVDQIINDH